MHDKLSPSPSHGGGLRREWSFDTTTKALTSPLPPGEGNVKNQMAQIVPLEILGQLPFESRLWKFCPPNESLN